MTLTPTLITILQPLIGLPCWQVVWDRNTNLALNFGMPFLNVREPQESRAESPRVREIFSYRHVTVRGAWLLWILHAYWKLTLRDGVSITSRSSQRRMQQALTRLDGQRLVEVMIRPTTGQTRFMFDLGAQLNVRRQQRRAEDLWMLYTPDAHVLSIRSDGNLSYQPETQPDDQPDQWYPIQSVTLVSK